MIEFNASSLANESNKGNFWQGLNAASIALQQAAQSETAVYKIFSQQLIQLGLHGSISLLDESGEVLYVTSIAFSEQLVQVIKPGEKVIKFNLHEFAYPAQVSEADSIVLAKGHVVFLPDNSEKMHQMVPPPIYQNLAPFLEPLLNLPAIFAPLFSQSDVIGVVYVSGADLQVEKVPALTAFTNHLSIALENARLFQAVQEAELKYRSLFELANEGIFLFDYEERKLISANPRMLKLLGLNDVNIERVRPSDWAAPHIQTLYSEHLQTVIQTGSHFFDVPFADSLGNLHYWQISATVIELNNKSILHGLVWDITEARRAEEALQQSEEQFRVLAENVPGTIYLCKNEPGFQILYVNDGIESLTGYTKEQFIAQEVNYTQLIHPDNRDEVDQILKEEALSDGQRFKYIYRIRHLSGAWRWAEDVGGGVFDEQGALLFLEGIISDITERVQADLLQKTVYRIAAAAHTNISLDQLYGSIHESLALILTVQNFYIALYDREADTISMPYFVDLYDSLSGEFKYGMGLTEFVIRTNDAKLLTRQEIKFYMKQGIVNVHGTMPQVWLGVPLQVQGQAIGALVVQSYEESTAYSEQDKQLLIFVSDQIASVVARKQAEAHQQELSAKLMRETRLLEAIFAATPDDFFVFDLDGRFRFISATILKLLNVSADFIVGKTWQELQFPAEFGRLDEARETILQTKQPVHNEFKYSLLGKINEFEYVTNPIFDTDGEVISFVTTAREVTERQQAIQAMHRTQKMESLGVLAGGIAHDFNNLLVAMMGQASMAQVHLAENHSSHAHLGKVIQAVDLAAGLTQQLLAYSGEGQFAMKPVNINKIIDESIEQLKIVLTKQIEVELILADSLPTIEADVTQLLQATKNLFINAAESIEGESGVIQVKTSVQQVTDKDKMFWQFTGQPLPPGSYVSLSIQDNGGGMSSEMTPKIFDPFFTTKFTGRGLGLAAVLGIMRGHNGGLSVSSELGKGTMFELLFPTTQEEAVDPPPQPEETSKVSDKLVLVIDDEAPVREAITDILDLEEIGVITADNGDTGIALYKARASEIDLVLLDLSMPGKSGRETFAELAEFDPNVRILLSSGYTEADITKDFDSPSLVGFLQKPYRLEVFLNEMQVHLNPE